MTDLGTRLFYARRQRGLELHTVAQASGLGSAEIANLEVGASEGDISLDVLIRLAAALSVTIAFITGDIEVPKIEASSYSLELVLCREDKTSLLDIS